MIRIAIVEDQESEQKKLISYLEQYQKENNIEFQIVAFKDGLQFIENYHCNQDVILMDIEMPKLNGFDAARKLREKDETAILLFITNLASYVYKGYQVQAMDYILKPIHYPDLSMRLDAIEKKLSKNKEYCLIINYKNGMKKISVSEIFYIESIGHDLILHLLKEDIQYRGPSLKSLEKELKPYGFSRCNHCYIVNLRYCEKIEGMILLYKREKARNFKIEKVGVF